jgi:uncharacterized membrane protein
VAVANPAAEFARVVSVVELRCASCHAAQPTQPGFAAAPKGVLLDSAAHIAAQATPVYQQVQSRAMPLGNLTGMTEAERQLVLNWYAAGARRL